MFLSYSLVSDAGARQLTVNRWQVQLYAERRLLRQRQLHVKSTTVSRLERRDHQLTVLAANDPPVVAQGGLSVKRGRERRDHDALLKVTEVDNTDAQITYTDHVGDRRTTRCAQRSRTWANGKFTQATQRGPDRLTGTRHRDRVGLVSASACRTARAALWLASLRADHRAGKDSPVLGGTNAIAVAEGGTVAITSQT